MCSSDLCRATQDRQEAVVEAAESVDLVIVVGSGRSSNSKRLVEVVRKRAGKSAYLVDSAADLRPEWFEDVGKVAVTSGASTPSRLTREVIKTLEQYPDPALALRSGGRTIPGLDQDSHPDWLSSSRDVRSP